MHTATALKLALGVAVVTIVAMSGHQSYAQSQNVLADPANSAPNPYKFDYGWAKLPDRRKWGAVLSVDIDRDGKSIWVFDRCEDARPSASNSKLDPIMKFDENGKLVKSFGGGMIIGSHGLLRRPRQQRLGVGLPRQSNGKGHTVMKFNQDGKLLMTLGKPGVAGNDHDHFNEPSDILVAPNGEHLRRRRPWRRQQRPHREVRPTTASTSRSGARRAKGPGEFDAPHSLAMDSAGRLFVADRGNNRIQIFDQDGKYLTEWKQFGGPSGLFIDKNDMLYVADNSPDERNPPFKSGHPHRQREGRQGHRLHPGSRRGQRRRRHRGRRCRQHLRRLHQHPQLPPLVAEEDDREPLGPLGSSLPSACASTLRMTLGSASSESSARATQRAPFGVSATAGMSAT